MTKKGGPGWITLKAMLQRECWVLWLHVGACGWVCFLKTHSKFSSLAFLFLYLLVCILSNLLAVCWGSSSSAILRGQCHAIFHLQPLVTQGVHHLSFFVALSILLMLLFELEKIVSSQDFLVSSSMSSVLSFCSLFERWHQVLSIIQTDLGHVFFTGKSKDILHNIGSTVMCCVTTFWSMDLVYDGGPTILYYNT